MADTFSKKDRSRIMAKVSSKETKPEKVVRKFIFSRGFRYRKNDKNLPGSPDVVLPKYKAVIFVNGCFWHCHPDCKYSKLPQSNTGYWEKKIEKNTERDRITYAELQKLGWFVIIVWECELKTKEKRRSRLESLVDELKQLIA
jgi:DNA mismatch endonuclease (patch repair protein)